MSSWGSVRISGCAPRVLFNHNPWALLNYYQYLNLTDVCLYCINVLQNFLSMFEGLRDWSQIDWKPRFCANYQHHVQMGQMLLWFLLLLSLLNLHRCLHKQYRVFIFLDLVISLCGELAVLLDVSDSEFAKFRGKVVVSPCSYYWLISAVYHLHYFFASAAWIFLYLFDCLLMVDGSLV